MSKKRGRDWRATKFCEPSQTVRRAYSKRDLAQHDAGPNERVTYCRSCNKYHINQK